MAYHFIINYDLLTRPLLVLGVFHSAMSLVYLLLSYCFYVRTHQKEFQVRGRRILQCLYLICTLIWVVIGSVYVLKG